MRNFRRILKWFLLGGTLLLFTVVIGAALYLRTENFQRWLRDEALGAVNETIRGTLSIDRVEGSVWRHLTLHGVTLRYQDDKIVEAPRLDLTFSLIPLLWSEVRISAIDALQPRVRLIQNQEGLWNLVEALSPRQPDSTKSSLVTMVRSVRLNDGHIDLKLAAADKVYRLERLNLDGGVNILPAALSVDLRELTSALIAHGQPDVNLKGALEYQQTDAGPAVVKLKNLWAVSRASQVILNGQIETGETAKVNARLEVKKLAPADIAYFLADSPIKRDLTGSLQADGALNALKGKVELAAAGASLSCNFTADVTGEQPKYTAAMKLSDFNLRQWLNDKNISGVMSGTIEAGGSGFALKNTTGKANLEIRAAEAQGWALGAVSLQGALAQGVAAIDGRLKSNLGGANWSGKILLNEKRPSYQVAFAVKDLDIQKTGAGGKALQGKLNFQGTVKGAGMRFADMDARADLRILPSSFGAVAIKQGELNAGLANKKIRIARAVLNTSDATLSVTGELGIDAQTAGKLDYRLRLANLSPWLALVDRKGAGALDLTGQALGNFTELQSQGTARLSAVRVDSTTLKSGNIKFALQRAQNRTWPVGTINAQLTDLDAGLALRRVDVNAKLTREAADSLEFDINAQDQRERRHGVNGTLDLVGDATVVHLREATLGAPDGAWKLAGPAVISWRDKALLIDQVALRNGARAIALNGRFAFVGKQDLNLSIDSLPLDTLAAFVAEPPKIAGLLALKARITGTAAAPEVNASARVSEASFAGHAYDGASADIAYRERKATVRLTVQQDATHALNGAGTVPLNLSWSDGMRADFADGMALRVQSSGVSLAFLNAFGGKAVENIAGELSLDIQARGSAKQPDLRGTFRLRDGKLKAIPLGVEIQSVAAAGDLDSRNLNLREFSAQAKDGEIRGNGSLALKNYDIGAVKLVLNARRWPAIETVRHQVKVDGNVEVEGTVSAPKLKGQITVTDGSLRPDLEFLEQSKIPFKRDETIVIVNHNGAGGQPQGKESKPSTDNDLFKAASVDLTVQAPRNVWIRHPDLLAELSGNVHVLKAPQRQIDLTGRVDVVRGWFAFQGRRFELQNGAIEFTGGDKINPALNIVARYKLPEYQVDATINGTVDKPALTLASQPRLEQADILALLIFGRPINSLNRNEQGALQQSAIGITSGYVASRIANSVSSALGLDNLGVDVRQVDFSGGQVGFGRYFGSKTYVSVSQQLTGERGREVAAEYQIAPDWKLGSSTSSTGSKGIDLIWQKRY